MSKKTYLLLAFFLGVALTGYYFFIISKDVELSDSLVKLQNGSDDTSQAELISDTRQAESIFDDSLLKLKTEETSNIDEAGLKANIKECVSASREEQQVICTKVINSIKVQIGSANIVSLKVILESIGVEQNPWVRDELWSVIDEFNGQLGSRALLEFYFDIPNGRQPSSAFYPLVAIKFADIASYGDLQVVISGLVSEDRRLFRKASTLLMGIKVDGYPELLEKAYFVAQPDVKKDIYLKIAEANSLDSFIVAKNIFVKEFESIDENEMRNYLLRLHFLDSDVVKQEAIKGVSSPIKAERLASYSVLSNFSNDGEVSKVLEDALESPTVRFDNLESEFIQRALK